MYAIRLAVCQWWHKKDLTDVNHTTFILYPLIPSGLGDIRGSIATVWRLGVMGDPLVEKYLMRDTDSPILRREVEAVHEWLHSGKVRLSRKLGMIFKVEESLQDFEVWKITDEGRHTTNKA